MGILRAILAIAVVCAHTKWNGGFVFTGGQAAVQCFYIISGFLISFVLSHNDAYAKVRRFYINRALRLYPIYWTVAFISLFAALYGDVKFLAVYRDAPLGAIVLLVFSNIALIGQDWVMFAAVHSRQVAFSSNFRTSDIPLFKGLVISQAWTLSVELCFYLLAPFIIKRRTVLLSLLISAFLLRACLLWNGLGFQDPWTYRFFPMELGMFLLGILSEQYLLPRWKQLTKSAKMIPATGTTIILLLTVTYFLVPVSQVYLLPAYLAAAVVLIPLAFLFQNACSIDKWIGDLSYPIYIGHMLIVHVMDVLLPKLRIRGDLRATMIDVTLSILLAIALNEVVGKRIEAIRTRYRSSPLKALVAS